MNTRELYDRDGERVHCGTVLYVKINGQWQWARYEMTGEGVGYFIYNADRTIDAAMIDGIDWTISRRR